MRKFFEILLKIIIVVSFICIIVFVGVAIINNKSIAYESYNYIVSTRDKTNFSLTQQGISQNLRIRFNEMSKDPIGEFINKAGIELNKGIDFFVDYLSQEDALTKGEQDKLINGYKTYAESFLKVKEAYLSYLEAYKEAEDKFYNDYENSDYAVETSNAKGLYIVTTYIQAYRNGSVFFKDLATITNKYIMPNLSYQTHKAQSYMIKIGYVDYSLDSKFNEQGIKTEIGVVEILNERLRIKDYSDYNLNNNTSVRAFNNYMLTSNNLSDKDYLTNASFREYSNTLNILNIYEWAGNYNNYYKTLNEDMKSKALATKTFYNANYSR